MAAPRPYKRSRPDDPPSPTADLSPPPVYTNYPPFDDEQRPMSPMDADEYGDGSDDDEEDGNADTGMRSDGHGVAAQRIAWHNMACSRRGDVMYGMCVHVDDAGMYDA